MELRDNDKKRYGGKGVKNAVANVNEKIADVLIGMNVLDQRSIDMKMCELDGTDNYMDWISGKIPSPPGGEDPTEFTKRLCLGLNRVVKTMMEKQVFEAAAVMHGGVIMSLFAAAALPRRRPVEWTCDPGTGFTVRITPSLYAKSGVIEVIDTIPAQSTADASFDEE